MINTITRLNNRLPWLQLFRFGIVGVSAACVNYALVVLQVEFLHTPPLLANVFAFMCAFFVSYFGHRHWTFAAQKSDKNRLFHYFLVASGGFLLNEYLFFAFMHYLQFRYTLALFLVLIIVPPLTFIASKLWAFK